MRAHPPFPALRSFRSLRCFQETLRSWWRGVEHRRDRKERREGRSRWRCPTLARRRPACRAGRSGSRARPSWAGEFGAKEWERTKWWRAELAGRATVISSRRARILKSCSTARQSRNPRRAAVSAEAQPQRPGIPAGTGWNHRRPMRPNGCGWCFADTAALREKSSRRTRILPRPCPQTDDQRIVANALLVVPEGLRRKLAGGKPAQRARPPVTSPNGPCPSGASQKFLAASIPQHFRHDSSPRVIFCDAPLGHGATRHGLRGRRPPGADWPPANLLRHASGMGTGCPRSPRVRSA